MLYVLVLLVLVGLGLASVPMEPRIKTLAVAVVVCCVVGWLLAQLGLLPIRDFSVTPLR